MQTPPAQLSARDLVALQRRHFSSGKTYDVDFRIEQLRALKTTIRKHETSITEALRADLGKPELEAYISEVSFIYEEITHNLKHVRKWAKPRRVPTPLAHFWSRSRIFAEPRGVTLNIAPWNYPFQLTLAPLVAAISAGNTMILKPSELAPATSAVIARLIRDAFPPEYVAVVEGAVDTTTELLAEPFDHIFFTGGTAVGRVIMTAAAKHLTPVTLELGGKSPCIVDDDVPIETTARRIVWGKFFNAGQTCVAPDYLLVPKRRKSELLAKMKEVLVEFYGADPSASPDYGRIVNDRHFARLSGLLAHGTVVAGGIARATDRYIAPTLLDGVTMNDAVMAEEIFGPILPVLDYERIEDAIAYVHQRPKPLALYLFTKNRAVEEKVMNEIQFGGGCINDCLIHLSSAHLPFGGVGPSGMGAYHGKFGFDLYSHQKGVLKKSLLFDPKLRYAPYTKSKLGWIKRIFS